MSKEKRRRATYLQWRSMCARFGHWSQAHQQQRTFGKPLKRPKLRVCSARGLPLRLLLLLLLLLLPPLGGLGFDPGQPHQAGAAPARTAQDTSARGRSAQDSSARDSSARDSSAQDTSARGRSAQDSSARDSSARGTANSTSAAMSARDRPAQWHGRRLARGHTATRGGICACKDEGPTCAVVWAAWSRQGSFFMGKGHL